MENPIKPLSIYVVICVVGLCICCGCGGGGSDPPLKEEGIINSVSAEAIVANALAMSQMASAGATAGFLYPHYDNVDRCISGRVTEIVYDSEYLNLIYDACMMDFITWDGQIIISLAKNDWTYDVTFGDTANSFRISQSQTTIYFPYLNTGERITLKGDMTIYDHADGYECLIQDLYLYHNTCDMQFLDADLYIGHYDQTQTQEVIFHGEIHSNLLPGVECYTTRRFVAEEQNYPSDGVILVTALDDGSNVFAIANPDASTVTLRIDTDNNSMIDSEIFTTWNSLKNNVDASLQEQFEFFWKY